MERPDFARRFPENCRDDPAQLAVIAYEITIGRRTILTYEQLQQSAHRIAANLLRLGIKLGEVLSLQLPNWWQFVIREGTSLTLATDLG